MCLVMWRIHSIKAMSLATRLAIWLFTMFFKLPRHSVSFMGGAWWRKATRGSTVLVAWFGLAAISSPETKASAMASSWGGGRQ